MSRSTLGLLGAPEGVSLDRYAEISAHLDIRTDEPARVVLDEAGLDERRWSEARKVWAERIEDEVTKASQPGQTSSVAERYPLSMQYAAVYAEAAKKARGDKDASGARGSAPALPRGEAERGR
jgi:hypothetical protein